MYLLYQQGTIPWEAIPKLRIQQSCGGAEKLPRGLDTFLSCLKIGQTGPAALWIRLQGIWKRPWWKKGREAKLCGA